MLHVYVIYQKTLTPQACLLTQVSRVTFSMATIRTYEEDNSLCLELFHNEIRILKY